jgi:uridylate kinase
MAAREKIIISVGGSLIVPQDGINTPFLTQLNTFIREELKENPHRQFFLVSGGGNTTRHYQKAAVSVIGHELTDNDLDWLGIHATRLNAQLLRTIFRDIAHPYLIKNYDIIRKVSEPVVIAAGWKPGWSTDYCAVMLCEDYGVSTVINMSNITQVFTKDPKEFSDATPIDTISWTDFRKIVGNKWSPGLNMPFDPIAAKKSQELGTKVIVLGNDFSNLRKYFKGEKFLGTIIE